MSALPPLTTVRADIAVGPLRAEAVAISPASLNNAQHGRGLRVFHLDPRGKVLGNLNLDAVRDRAVASVKAEGDRFAKNVAPIIREIQSSACRCPRGATAGGCPVRREATSLGAGLR
jgi:hypothetical protein